MAAEKIFHETGRALRRLVNFGMSQRRSEHASASPTRRFAADAQHSRTRWRQRSPAEIVLRGCPQKYTLILTCGLQNYFSEKSLRRSRKAENFSDDFESAYEVVYISRRFLSDPRVSGPAVRRRRLPNRRVEWSNSTIKTSVIARGKR